jgi:hypothetical protein
MRPNADEQLKRLVVSTGNAMDELPILSRLEFVKNLLTLRGGNRDDRENEPALVLAVDVLNGVMDVLKTTPAGRLRAPEP